MQIAFVCLLQKAKQWCYCQICIALEAYETSLQLTCQVCVEVVEAFHNNLTMTITSFKTHWGDLRRILANYVRASQWANQLHCRMDELGFYIPSTVFQSFRDDGWKWKALCNEAPFRFGKNLASNGKPATLWTEVGSANHSAMWTLLWRCRTVL